MIKSEYHRFLQKLTVSGVPEEVSKIANLVADNLEQLIPLTTYQGQRVRRIVDLAQANWDAISSQIEAVEEGEEERSSNFTKITCMEVGPFRGFAQKEVFDIASRLVLVYGPNGTGKSSFCEALEYGLLGNVAEAENKRFRDQREYLKNAYVKEFSPPKIYADDGQGNVIEVSPNEQGFRFCFVEKNRIDNFSRIAAQAPAKQTELISTLFGLDSFNDFVRNFTAEIDDRYIDKIGRNGLILAKKQQELSGAQQQIHNSSSELERVASDEITLANRFKDGITFSQMVLEINGTDEAPGIIEQLESELQQSYPPRSNLHSAELEALGNLVASNVQQLNAKKQELANASQQLSFRQLYEAVSSLKTTSPDACPACKTPLDRVMLNPYLLVEQELHKLQGLSAIEKDIEQLTGALTQALFRLSQNINKCLEYYPQNNPIKPYELLNNVQPSIEWWYSIHQKLDGNFSAWDHLTAQVKQLEESDKRNDQAVQFRSQKQTELNTIREYARQVTILQTRKETATRAAVIANETIRSFQARNEALIRDVEAEKALVLRNQNICSAYEQFVKLLNNYSNNLPAQLVADLGESVVTLYNAFNRNDSANELLADVRLPLEQNQRLEIAFQNQPKEYFDALHVLSEGHIRCLGLAILLAKNHREQAPVLIFDDPVNAIDDDHRESIRKTLFEDAYFSEKQILLTCHGEEFFKDIHNLLSAPEAREAKSFTFLPSNGHQHIRVDFNCAPRNYILAAREHFNRNEIRDALAKSRQALESLTKGKVWKYVTRYGDGNLSLKLRSPSASIELRNLTEQLKRKIVDSNFSDQDKQNVLEPIDTLLGLNGDSREWRYLNKGTHEEGDRAEFDRHTAEVVVSNLERLDIALS